MNVFFLLRIYQILCCTRKATERISLAGKREHMQSTKSDPSFGYPNHFWSYSSSLPCNTSPFTTISPFPPSHSLSQGRGIESGLLRAGCDGPKVAHARSNRESNVAFSYNKPWMCSIAVQNGVFELPRYYNLRRRKKKTYSYAKQRSHYGVPRGRLPSLHFLRATVFFWKFHQLDHWIGNGSYPLLPEWLHAGQE